jgi:linoleoyl-CoA desaturase
MNPNPFLTSYPFTSPPSEFAKEVRKRVRAHLKNHKRSRHANSALRRKAAFMVMLFLVSYFLIIFEVGTNQGWFWVWETTQAIGFIGIGMSFTHDASHGAFSSNRRKNFVLRHCFDLVGPSSVIWQIQHVILHHQFTNIEGIDEDIRPSDWIRMTPEAPWRFWHRFQPIYGWFVYMLNTIYWVTLKDIECLIRYHQRGYFNAAQLNVKKEALKMLVFKSFYFGYILILPMLVTDLGWSKVLLGWLLMQALGGFTLAMIIQPGHVILPLAFTKTRPGMVHENAPMDRMEYQTTTTANYGNGSKILTWFSGGLNFQIEHHLFPEISHVHYSTIAPIVKQTADEFKLPYHHNRTWWSGILAHAHMLRILAIRPETSSHN